MRDLRRGRSARPLTGICITLASGLFAAGCGLGLASLVETLAPRGSLRFLGISDEEVVVSLALAGIIWLIFMVWLWRPVVQRARSRPSAARAAATARRADEAVRQHRWLGPSIMTLAIGGAVTSALIGIDALHVRGDEFANAAAVLLGMAGAMLAWLPTLARIDRGFVATTPEGRIHLRCPNCDYCLNGLREARCPECAAAFTLDELVALQA